MNLKTSNWHHGVRQMANTTNPLLNATIAVATGIGFATLILWAMKRG